MNNIYKNIYKEIRKYDTIVIARHIGADPDAIGCQLALKELTLNNFPHKKVYAIGTYASKFKFIGSLDKLEDNINLNTCLLICLDTPDIKRIDGADPKDFEYVIKIDHHPIVDKFGDIELIDDNASSTCQLILELVYNTKFKITPSIAKKLYIGISSDTDRFLHPYTTVKTFKLVTRMLSETKIDFTSLYKPLYTRPLVEARFQGYIYEHFEVTEHGVGFIKIDDSLIKEYKVDTSTAGSLINSLKYIDGVLIIIFLTEDKKANLIKANIRSEGPIINEIATIYGGGGHKYASGAKLTSWDQADNLIKDLDILASKYLESEK